MVVIGYYLFVFDFVINLYLRTKPMSHKKSIIKESTQKRCMIIKATEEALQSFRAIGLEQFHLLYETSDVDFSIYVKV